MVFFYYFKGYRGVVVIKYLVLGDILYMRMKDFYFGIYGMYLGGRVIIGRDYMDFWVEVMV